MNSGYLEYRQCRKCVTLLEVELAKFDMYRQCPRCGYDGTVSWFFKDAWYRVRHMPAPAAREEG